jgi:hypothetical protein
MHHVARGRTQAELLSLVDVLEPLSHVELEELAARCPGIRYRRGEDLYYPEERGHANSFEDGTSCPPDW